MEWSEVVEHPALRDLPFKIELNEFGEIVMTPGKVSHSMYRGEIGNLLQTRRLEGACLMNCAIKTRRGTKVADVAWASSDRMALIRDEAEASVAPQICVEIVYAKREMNAKKKLYFESGAEEVWFCNEHGDMTFYAPKNRIERSNLFPDFPYLTSQTFCASQLRSD